jgi:putative membrane protein
MNARLSSFAAVVLGVLLIAAPASAAVPADVSPQDREYLNRAHQGNLFEMVTGNLVDRGDCTRVRELGAQFTAHHTALDADLVAVAAGTGVTLYSAPDSIQLADIADEAARTGRDFDLAWLRDQIAEHHRGISLAERETRYGWSSAVKELAARSAPVLQGHLDDVLAALETCGRA